MFRIAFFLANQIVKIFTDNVLGEFLDHRQIFGSFLDKNVVNAATFVVSTFRNPSLEMRVTTRAVGMGVLVSLILFSVFLIARF